MEIKITNSKGESIQFGRLFKLYEKIDLSGLKAENSLSESTQDGSRYNRTRLETRDLNIPFYIQNMPRVSGWMQTQRKEAYRVFNPNKNPMRIDFKTKSGDEYYLNAQLTQAPEFPKDFDNSNCRWQKALLQFICADPYIYEKNKTLVEIATWIGGFEFDLEIPESTGIEMSVRSPSLIANVENRGQQETGMLIRFKALGSLSTPSLINVDTHEEFKLNLTMQAGDEIEVSTYKGNRYAKLTRSNVTTSVFSKIDIESNFLQLQTGDNLFRYDAETNLENLEVSMTFSNKLIGV